jgi:hypothetical protein
MNSNQKVAITFKNINTNVKASIKLESLLILNSAITRAEKNLKKLEVARNQVYRVNYKNLKGLVDTLYYELWFMFMDEIIHIQKLILGFFREGQTQPISANEIIYKIRLLMKPVPTKLFKINSVALVLPQQIYNCF